ncbi:MAG: spermidine synthase [Planctomycetota bacterium]|nr:spermidine synthase [Planctomycetota bacterium]
MSAAPRLEILEYCETPLGLLCLRRRELLSQHGTIVTEVSLDHEFLMSSFYTLSEQALASLAIDWHGGSGLHVLVGGLGLGYTAHTALKCSGVERVDVLELLPQVISWLSRDLVPLAGSLLADRRFRVAEGDILERLGRSPQTRHDVILIDIDHSPDEVLDPRNRSFYTATGLRRTREHLADGGVLAVWSSAASDTFARALEAVFSEVRLETIAWRNDLIDEDQRDDIFLARR